VSEERVSTFSIVRWGIGGTIMLSLALIVSSALLYSWFKYHSYTSLVLSIALFAAVAIVVFVKLNEEIHPTRYIDREVIGKTGVVISASTSVKPAVVKVDSQLWSAKCSSPLNAGDRVVVKARDGIYLIVEKVETYIS
jgi:membrane protein implicated in regulation of membrane protease activity